MTSAALPARRLWIVVTALALLCGQAGGLAVASAAAPAEKHDAGAKPGKKGKGKKKAAAQKKPAKKPVPSPQPQQPAPTQPDSGAPGPHKGFYRVIAEGGFSYASRRSESTAAAPYENKTLSLAWTAVGSASVTPGATGSDFRITGALLEGVLTSYGHESSWGSTRKDYDHVTPVTCADSIVTTVVDGGHRIGLSLSGTTADDLRVDVGNSSVPGVVKRSPSSQPICAHPPGGSYPSSVPLAPGYSFPASLTGDMEFICASEGSYTTGWSRDCTAILSNTSTSGNLTVSETFTWTMKVTLSPDTPTPRHLDE